MKKLKFVIFTMSVLIVTAAAPVHAQSFLDGLFGGGSAGHCGTTNTHFVSCDSETGVGAIGDLIRITVIIMTTLIGVVSVGAIGYAGVLYASAQDDKEKVASAVKIIRNVVVGLIMYALTIAIISWLIPGSVIETPAPVPAESGQVQNPDQSQTPTGSNPQTVPLPNGSPNAQGGLPSR